MIKYENDIKNQLKFNKYGSRYDKNTEVEYISPHNIQSQPINESSEINTSIELNDKVYP